MHTCREGGQQWAGWEPWKLCFGWEKNGVRHRQECVGGEVIATRSENLNEFECLLLCRACVVKSCAFAHFSTEIVPHRNSTIHTLILLLLCVHLLFGVDRIIFSRISPGSASVSSSSQGARSHVQRLGSRSLPVGWELCLQAWSWWWDERGEGEEDVHDTTMRRKGSQSQPDDDCRFALGTMICMGKMNCCRDDALDIIMCALHQHVLPQRDVHISVGAAEFHAKFHWMWCFTAFAKSEIGFHLRMNEIFVTNPFIHTSFHCIFCWMSVHCMCTCTRIFIFFFCFTAFMMSTTSLSRFVGSFLQMWLKMVLRLFHMCQEPRILPIFWQSQWSFLCGGIWLGNQLFEPCALCLVRLEEVAGGLSPAFQLWTVRQFKEVRWGLRHRRQRARQSVWMPAQFSSPDSETARALDAFDMCCANEPLDNSSRKCLIRFAAFAFPATWLAHSRSKQAGPARSSTTTHSRHALNAFAASALQKIEVRDQKFVAWGCRCVKKVLEKSQKEMTAQCASKVDMCHIAVGWCAHSIRTHMCRSTISNSHQEITSSCTSGEAQTGMKSLRCRENGDDLMMRGDTRQASRRQPSRPSRSCFHWAPEPRLLFLSNGSIFSGCFTESNIGTQDDFISFGLRNPIWSLRRMSKREVKDVPMGAFTPEPQLLFFLVGRWGLGKDVRCFLWLLFWGKVFNCSFKLCLCVCACVFVFAWKWETFGWVGSLPNHALFSLWWKIEDGKE